jgi:RNA polymerase sigma-70 factor (ECF subfamily)
MDDQQAVQDLKRGNIHGLEVLVVRYQTKAIRAAFLVTHDEDLAQDVVQDAFLRVYQRIHQFDESKSFEPYFMRSVVNASLNAIQARNRFVSYENNTETVERLFSQAASVESDMEYREIKQQILNALKKLEPRQRAAIVQRYYLNMSEKEMAQSLAAPQGTIKWMLNNARVKLRELLGSERGAK